ncbi:hypothetical protein ARMGADRAFT_1029115 [Armillaria gallica]|uniref:Uncharacterized protein n=1 Tax=Armillaria gallica TaxID=47427 RepID=A0A2H3DKY6_ARMGA|nr:hypothetical protein ARMGADRAFT_1029115 [Armillaria gallica]
MDRLSRRFVATFLNSLPQTRSRRWSHTSSITPIQAFFARYPQFSYDRSKETMAQFHDMTSQPQWTKATRHEALSEIQSALVQQFNQMYGGDANDLHDWKRLCKVVSRRGMVPNDIGACKVVIKSVYVNICDLVDHPATKVPLPIHDTETALSEYTLSSYYKFFPRGAADGHEMLRLLQRNIFDPSRERGKSSTKSGEGEESGTGEAK